MRHLIKYLRQIDKPLSPLFKDSVTAGALIGAAAVSGVSSLLSSIFGGNAAQSSSEMALQAQREANDTNLRISRETNQANYDLYKEQYADSKKLWEANNEYNSPSNQTARLEAAGLNPSLAFGGANTSTGAAALPSAAPAQGATVSPAPYEAYSDSFLKGFADKMPNIAESLNMLQDYKSKLIDNQTRDAMNRKKIEDLQSTIDYKLSQKLTDEKYRDSLISQREGLDLINRLNDASYDDMLSQRKLANRFQELQSKWLEDENVRADRRMIISELQAKSQKQLNDAQIRSIDGMLSISRDLADLEITKDGRIAKLDDLDMSLKQLDRKLKLYSVVDSDQKSVFNAIMRDSELKHTKLKDASILNQMAERAFGLGFRDLGNLFKALPK